MAQSQPWVASMDFRQPGGERIISFFTCGQLDVIFYCQFSLQFCSNTIVQLQTTYTTTCTNYVRRPNYFSHERPNKNSTPSLIIALQIKISFRRSKSFKKYDESSFTRFPKKSSELAPLGFAQHTCKLEFGHPKPSSLQLKSRLIIFFIKPDDLKSHPLILQTTYNVEQYDIESDEWYEIQDMGIFRSALGCTIIKNVKLDILRKFCAPRDPLPLQHHTNKSE